MYRTSSLSKRIVMTAVTLMLAVSFVVAFASPAMGKSYSRRTVKKIIRTVGHKKGLSSAQIRALLIICKRESGYRPKARNHSCKGLFQLKTHWGYSKWTDPYWNTRKAIRYIKHRYGTCRAALRHSYRYGWY